MWMPVAGAAPSFQAAYRSPTRPSARASACAGAARSPAVPDPRLPGPSAARCWPPRTGGRWPPWTCLLSRWTCSARKRGVVGLAGRIALAPRRPWPRGARTQQADRAGAACTGFWGPAVFAVAARGGSGGVLGWEAVARLPARRGDARIPPGAWVLASPPRCCPATSPCSLSRTQHPMRAAVAATACSPAATRLP